ncbi:MAG: ParA family protein [Thermodesulfobacteriota bacterium]
MALVAFISQKGGVGKSSLSQALTTEAVRSGLRAKLADLDNLQGSSIDWSRIRIAQGVDPEVPVQQYGTLAAALREATDHDYFVIDGAARSTQNTMALAQEADLLIQPTGPSLSDLRVGIRVFNELKGAGILVDRLVFVLYKVGSIAEEADARNFIVSAGYRVLKGSVPEKVAFRTCLNNGKAITEVSIRSLRVKAEELVDSITKELK